MGNQSALHLKHAMVCDCACAVYIFIANWYPYTIGALTACACEMQLKVDFFIEYVPCNIRGLDISQSSEIYLGR